MNDNLEGMPMRNDLGCRNGNIRIGGPRCLVQRGPTRPGFQIAILVFSLFFGTRAGAEEIPVEKVIWVRGETYLVEPPGDSLPNIDLESSLDGRRWSKSNTRRIEVERKKLLSSASRGTPAKQFFRLRNAKTGKVRRRMEVTILPEAGSSETGPYLHLMEKWDGELIREQAGARANPPRSRAFLNAAFRLSKARGGASLANSYDRINRMMLDTVHAYSSSMNVLPILVCRTFFHYVHKDPSQARRGQYARISLGTDTSESNLVTFMSRPLFVLTNIPDPITEIEVLGDGFSLTLPPDGKAEALISGSGLKRIKFVVRFASGKKMPGEAMLFVKRALSPEEIERRNDNLSRNYEVSKSDINFSEEVDR